MKFTVTAGAVIAATAVSAQSCVKDPLGNSYCQEATGITYSGVGGTGSYNQVTDMYSPDVMSPDGTCTSSPFGYSGTMSPLDEEVRVPL